jgi:hypothetical protein
MLYIQNAEIYTGTGKTTVGTTFVKRWKVCGLFKYKKSYPKKIGQLFPHCE